MKIDARRVSAFLRNPGSCRLVLLYGEDAGLVRERADLLVRSAAGSLRDPFRVAELDREHLGRLPEEMSALSLDGGRRVIRVRDAADSACATVQAALEAPGTALLVLEAPALPPRSKLRALAERDPQAAAVPCYREEGQTLRTSIESLLSERAVPVTPDALDWLAAHLGADRASTVAEIDKLALLAAGTRQLELSEVEAAIGDAAARRLEDALFSATAGDRAAADRGLTAALSEGMSPVAVLRAALFHCQRLDRALAVVAQGTSPTEAARSARPPIFSGRLTLFARALGGWSQAAMQGACRTLWAAELACKRTGAPAETVCRDAILALATRSGTVRPGAMRSSVRTGRPGNPDPGARDAPGPAARRPPRG